MEIYSILSLKIIQSFGEKIEIYNANADLNINEEFYNIWKLNENTVKRHLDKDHHWCIDQALTIDEKENEYEEIEEVQEMGLIIPVSNLPTQKYIIYGEPGVGKTCLLHSLWYKARDYKLGKIKFPDIEERNSIPFTPVYFCARRFIEIKKANQNFSFTKCIAKAASEELELVDKKTKQTIILLNEAEEIILDYLETGKILLLIDNIDLLIYEDQLKLLQIIANTDNTSSNKIQVSGSGQSAFPSGRIILVSSGLYFRYIIEREENKINLFKNHFTHFQVTAGVNFNILYKNNITAILSNWKMTPSMENLKFFENSLRKHRIKLYPATYQSPILLYIISWKLSQKSNFIDRTDDQVENDFSLFDLLEDLFNYSISNKFQLKIQPFVTINENLNQKKENIATQLQALNENTPAQPANGAPTVPEPQTEVIHPKKYDILIKYGIGVVQLKRLCSLFGYLIHWYCVKSVHSDHPDRSLHYNRNSIYHLSFLDISQIKLIEIQLGDLLLKPGIPTMLGFDTVEDHVEGVDSSKLSLNMPPNEVHQLVLELSDCISDFFDLTDNGKYIL